MEFNGLTAIVGFFGTAFGFVITFLTFTRNRDKEVGSNAAEQAIVNTKLDSISSGVDSARVDLKMLEKEHSRVMERVIRNEEKADSAHKRIDKLEERVNEN